MSVQNDSGARTSRRRGRKPKQPNSPEFHDLLDRALALSVTERVRLVRALGGLQGLVVNNPRTPIVETKLVNSNVAKPKEKKGKESLPVPPNPLKNSVFKTNLDNAQAALRDRKAELGLDKLPPTDPTVVALVSAMQSYKEQHSVLKPYDEVTDTSKRAADRLQIKRQRQASKSPERKEPPPSQDNVKEEGSTTGSMSLRQKTLNTLSNAKNTVVAATTRRNSKSGKQQGSNPDPKDQEEDDVDMSDGI